MLDNLKRIYSPNFDIRKRKPKSIEFIILHYTGMKKEKDALERLTNQNSKVSCHYFITYSGEIINLVPDLYISWHAGKSKWRKIKSLNNNSIGIEIANQAFVDVKVTTDGGSTFYHVAKKINIPPSNTLTLDKPINLESNDVLRVVAHPLPDSSSISIEAYASILEIS